MKAWSLFTLFFLTLILCGCITTPDKGSAARSQKPSVLLTEFQNATPDEHASTTVTDIVGTLLLKKGISFESFTPNHNLLEDNKPQPREAALAHAKSKGLPYVVTGVVHEYRYKVDLNGDPVVGMTLTLLDSSTGQVAWQASGSHVGIGINSLTSTAQVAARKLISSMPLGSNRGSKKTR